MGDAWTALSTLISGIGIWGGVGAIIDHFAHTWPVFFVAGVLVGNFAGTYLIYIRYFRNAPTSVRYELPGERHAA